MRQKYILRISIFLALVICIWILKSEPFGSISISTPQDGATLTGTTVNVIPVLHGLTCQSVTAIIDGVGFGLATQPPYQVSIPMPQNLAKKTRIKVFCITPAGKTIDSPIINVSIDSGVQYSGIAASPSPLRLLFPGSQMPLTVKATTSTGSLVSVSNSTRITYTFDDPGVASIANGVVTALGAGSTTLRIKTGQLEADVNISVPKLIPGDLTGDGRVDMDDLNELQTWQNTAASGPNDARDLNHDGVINALDARILTTLCTYPKCATHP